LFLQAFPVEASVEGGRFRGWRVMAGVDPAYAGAGLAAGDVVVSVNKGPIERPEQALKVWQSLTIAPELRVAFERGGERREIAFPIDQ
jgi:type II secretory pathway component PulC